MRGRGKLIRRCRRTELAPAHSHRPSYAVVGCAGEKADPVGHPAFIVRRDDELRGLGYFGTPQPFTAKRYRRTRGSMSTTVSTSRWGNE